MRIMNDSVQILLLAPGQRVPDQRAVSLSQTREVFLLQTAGTSEGPTPPAPRRISDVEMTQTILRSLRPVVGALAMIQTTPVHLPMMRGGEVIDIVLVPRVTLPVGIPVILLVIPSRPSRLRVRGKNVCDALSALGMSLEGNFDVGHGDVRGESGLRWVTLTTEKI
jgi:hypothetical protein